MPTGETVSFQTITTTSSSSSSDDSSRVLFQHGEKQQQQQGTPPFPSPSGQPPNQGAQGYERKDHKKLAAELLGGAAVLGGGIWAYEHHKHKKEEEEEERREEDEHKRQEEIRRREQERRKQEELKQQVWREEVAHKPEVYYQNVDHRMEKYNNERHHLGPVHWVESRNGQIPPDAIPAGHESNGETLYVARAWCEGGVHPGKIGRHLNGAHICFAGQELEFERYEVLCGNPESVGWIGFEGQLHAAGFKPIDGGREADGNFIFVIIADFEGGVHPGKYSEGFPHALIAFGGEEVPVRRYRVGAYARNENESYM